ncbi:3-hydroxyacyl-ACP dehydratase FabZ family protein [Amycolatopsis panacis]|uniref:Beta-hydroxyacyl-ACP dehydratase n=1 Tax=Amycolatopsis panacis TaxID=2340917 RepID=A0A419HJN1_9PSEU|nr:beta-hydroxyacyl-ACP dehydratase [Amycolatopsis panacis]RJQ75850.1 beta-hydroxyacyl-ACP dehydratase [Amycolatopsis panacis]
MNRGYAHLLALLPVRHPMVLVDRITALDPGHAIETAKAVTGGEPCYGGLAAGLPEDRYAYPRSLVLESFGQSAALLWLDGRSNGDDDDAVPMVGKLRDCRFAGAAFPGDVIRHFVRLDRVAEDNAFLSGESRVGDRVLLTVGTLIAVARPASVVRSG